MAPGSVIPPGPRRHVTRARADVGHDISDQPGRRFEQLVGSDRPGLATCSLPGPRTEAWRYTPLRALERRSFATAAPVEVDAALLAGIPAPLGVGRVELADGSQCPGFICETYGVEVEFGIVC